MGEFADMALDQAIAEWCDEEFQMDAMEEGTGGGRYPYTNRTKVCRYCKKGGFVWKETDYGWRLHDTAGEIHTCDAYDEAQQEPSRDITQRPRDVRPATRGKSSHYYMSRDTQLDDGMFSEY